MKKWIKDIVVALLVAAGITLGAWLVGSALSKRWVWDDASASVTSAVFSMSFVALLIHIRSNKRRISG